MAQEGSRIYANSPLPLYVNLLFFIYLTNVACKIDYTQLASIPDDGNISSLRR